MQDVFVTLCKKRSVLDDRGLSSLLYRMATNHSLNQIRHRKSRPEDARSDILHQISVIQERLSNQNEARNLLGKLFSKEPQELGVTAVLHWVDGMTLQEVADAQNLSVSGVRRRLTKIRDRLQNVDLETLSIHKERPCGA